MMQTISTLLSFLKLIMRFDVKNKRQGLVSDHDSHVFTLISLCLSSILDFMVVSIRLLGVTSSRY